MIKDNLKIVRKNISEACKRSGRREDEVTLICVSKTKPVEAIIDAIEANEYDFGENKVQELCDKYDIIENTDVSWHMIGHLQRNKVKYIIGKTKLIHSVDSLRLAKQIQDESEKKGVITDVLIEVNVAEEESKFGIKVNECEDFVRTIAKYSNIRIKGLMTIAPFVSNPEENRKIFKELKKLYVDIREKNIDNVIMETLSMGMTNDYEIAIEEGATMVRVGTGIFGERQYFR